MWMKAYLAWHRFFVLWDVSKKKKKIKSVIYWIYFYEKINAVQWNLYLEIITSVDKIWYLSLETSQLNLTNGLWKQVCDINIEQFYSLIEFIHKSNLLFLIFYRDQGWDFLPLRAWVGLWSAFLLLLIVAFDLSALVKYITRFTEESFACLIAIIFIVEAFKKLFSITDKHPFNIHPEIPLDYNCSCYHPNYTIPDDNMTSFMGMSNETTLWGYSVISDVSSIISENMNATDYPLISKDDCKKKGFLLIGSGCDTVVYHDNVFFLSILLFLGTFTVAWGLKEMKTGRFFPTIVSYDLLY